MKAPPRGFGTRKGAGKDLKMNYNKDDVIDNAKGNWRSILSAAGFPVDLLDGKHHPCPLCDGTDRFRAFNDVDETGGVICNQCHEGGDGFATLMWFCKWSFIEALEFVAQHVGCTNSAPVTRRDIIELVAADKNMPLEAFRLFEPEANYRGKRKVARIPLWDEKGEKCTYFDLSPGKKGLFKKGGGIGLFLPGRVPVRGETWLLVEGVKDAAALVGLGYNACGLPTSRLDAKNARLFRDVDIVVVPDLDEAGEAGARHTAGVLFGNASSVRVARLQGELRKSGGDDVRDVIRSAGEESVKQSIEEASKWEPSVRSAEDDDRPEIEIKFQESKTIDDVIHALGTHRNRDELPTIYQRGGQVVRVTCEPRSELCGVTIPTATPRITAASKAVLRPMILDACRLWVWEENEDGMEVMTDKKPPLWLVAAIHELGDYPIEMSPLAGIVQCPTLRADGSIIQKKGYDQRSRLLYMPDAACEYLTVPSSPTIAEAKQAAETLVDLVCDFPFADDYHKSAWLSLVLTMVVRPAINGPCPIFIFDANTRGSGKSMLADLSSMIAYGKPAARKTWPGDDDEVRKTITAVVLAGLPSVLFDNVETGLKLGGASLDAALTGTTWSDRILGKSEITPELPLTQVWVATGNNLSFRGDTGRRAMYCRLESPEENPEDRTDFKHEDLLAHVRQYRGQLVTAALTLMRAWFVAGRPSPAQGPWGSFEAWNGTVRQAIVWCGLPDPMGTKKELIDADSSAEQLAMLHTAFDSVDPDRAGITTAELLARYERDDCPEPLAAAIAECVSGHPTARKLGSVLKKHKGRVRKGMRLEQFKTNSGRPWVLQKIMEGHHIVVSQEAVFCKHIDTDADSPNNRVEYGKVFCKACDQYLGRIQAKHPAK